VNLLRKNWEVPNLGPLEKTFLERRKGLMGEGKEEFCVNVPERSSPIPNGRK